MKYSHAQIVATVGPASTHPDILDAMIGHQMDVARFNFTWPELETRVEQIATIRTLEKKHKRHIPIMIDLPGPRIQEEGGHSYDPTSITPLTEEDKEHIAFGVKHGVDYFALSFVGKAEDVELCREIIQKNGGNQKIIAKIERAVALETLENIVNAADAVMVARGDLGNEVPLERIPFVQHHIIQVSKKANKPVIVATQMLLSMVDNPTPTRAEVTDVAAAILQGADAVMLSEESARGKYPVETVIMMEKIVLEAERNLAIDAPDGVIHINQLHPLTS